MMKYVLSCFVFILLMIESEVFAQPVLSDAGKPDVFVYISPTKSILTQSGEQLLNSQEWTDFFLAAVGQLDRAYFQKTPPSLLMEQTQTLFAHSPASSNDLLNFLFSRCPGIWVNLKIDPATLHLLPDTVLGTVVVDIQGVYAENLLVALMNEMGFTEHVTRPDQIHSCTNSAGQEYLFDSLEPFPTDTSFSTFILGRTLEGIVQQKTAIMTDSEMMKYLKTDEPAFLSITFNESAMLNTQRFFESIPEGHPYYVFAPGMIELTRRLLSISCVMAEQEGETILSITMTSRPEEKNGETVRDLKDLFIGIRQAFNTWSQGRNNLQPVQFWGLAILNSAEIIDDFNDDHVFHLQINMGEPQLLNQLKDCFVYWKDKVENQPTEPEN